MSMNKGTDLKNAYFSKLYRRGDAIMVRVQAALLLLSLAIAGWHDTWLQAMLVGLPTLALCAWLAAVHGGQRVTRCAIGAAMMVFSALLIHQSHGMIEMHFAVFVLLAFMLFYRDWLPLVIAAGLIALHHAAFYLLQHQGQPFWVFS